jgi:transaldolase/glucose-6-phosphate isomerase
MSAETFSSTPVPRNDHEAMDALVEQHLQRLDKLKAVQRLWQRDGSLFSEDATVQRDVRNRLGWMFSTQVMRDQIERLAVLARIVERQGYDRVLVIGMGGSSLWPEVIGKHLQGKRGLPIRIVDTTHPEAIADTLTWCREGKPLFIYATKSGGTIEPLSIYRALRPHFDDGQHFVAITDPGSGLEKLAKDEKFRETFLNPPDIGGRFSAASMFGLVPGVLAGVVLQDALQRVADMLEACHDEDVHGNPGTQLGAVLAAAQQTGRWQMRVALGKDVKGFGAWIEQLVAESTGKHGIGLLPIVGGVDGTGPELAKKLEHCLVVGLTTFTHPDEDFLGRATEAGVPVSAIVMPQVADLWTEVVRWEFATAICGLLLGINPFDEPDVTSAKTATSALLNGTQQPVEPQKRAQVTKLSDLPGVLKDELAAGTSDDYLAVLCYLAPSAQTWQRLETLRQALQARTQAAVVVQMGPRYLHSTGQFHKGGMPRGRFVLVHDFGKAVPDIAIPGQPFGFATLVRAQAEGDVAVLTSRGKPVTVVELAQAAPQA